MVTLRVWIVFLGARENELAFSMLHVVLPFAGVLGSPFFVIVPAVPLLDQAAVPSDVYVAILMKYVDISTALQMAVFEMPKDNKTVGEFDEAISVKDSSSPATFVHHRPNHALRLLFALFFVFGSAQHLNTGLRNLALLAEELDAVPVLLAAAPSTVVEASRSSVVVVAFALFLTFAEVPRVLNVLDVHLLYPGQDILVAFSLELLEHLRIELCLPLVLASSEVKVGDFFVPWYELEEVLLLQDRPAAFCVELRHGLSRRAADVDRDLRLWLSLALGLEHRRESTPVQPLWVRESLALVAICSRRLRGPGNVLEDLARLLGRLRARLDEFASFLTALGQTLTYPHGVEKIPRSAPGGAQELWLGLRLPFPDCTFALLLSLALSLGRQRLRALHRELGVVTRSLQISQPHMERPLESRGHSRAIRCLGSEDGRPPHLELALVVVINVVEINIPGRGSESHLHIGERLLFRSLQDAFLIRAHLMNKSAGGRAGRRETCPAWPVSRWFVKSDLCDPLLLPLDQSFEACALLI